MLLGQSSPASSHRKRGLRDQALGRSREGLTTKIHLLTDGKGRPLRFLLTPGQSADISSAAELIEGMRAETVIADKGYDSRDFRELIRSKRMKVVIPPRSNRKRKYRYNRSAYKERNLVERCFNKLKQFAESPLDTSAWIATSCLCSN